MSSAALCYIEIKDWNGSLSPWEFADTKAKKDFSGGGRALLDSIANDLSGKICRSLSLSERDTPKIIGGYSLAGLFALWSAYETDIFSSAVSCSGSLWFPEAREYFLNNKTKSDCVYLSLGRKEENAKDIYMRAVGDCTRDIYAYLNEYTNAFLEWNEGGHFSDVPLRTAKGFAHAVRYTAGKLSCEA